MPDVIPLKFADLTDGYNANLRSVRGVEVFKVGEWNGDKYDESDIDEMILAFGSQGYGVPLKLGHEEVSGAQAFGWVERIYRVGDTLKADFKDIPSWIFQWVFIDHAYDQVSIEIYFNLKRNGKTFKRALKAVALLGAETPAVSGLAPLREAIFAPEADTFEKVAFASVKVSKIMPDPVKTVTVDNTAEIAALTTKLGESGALVATLQAQLAEQNAALASVSTQLAALSANDMAREIEDKLKAVKVPAVREHIRHLYSVAQGKTEVVKFAATTGVVEKTLTAVVDELVSEINKFADGLTGQPRFSPKAVRNVASSSADAGEELATATRTYMEEHKLPMAKYGEAMQKVLATNPELRERYNSQVSGAN